MAEEKNTVEFYFDPVCPWCWITSRWIEDVGQQKDIHVTWKFFSLKKINEGRDIPPRFKPIHLMGLRALRVAAAVRETYGLDPVGNLYTAMGTRRHHDQVDIGIKEELVAILQSCKLPPEFASAADDKTRDRLISADMNEAIAKAGSDVGVPLIVLDGGAGPGFFGPVLSPAPTGKSAVELWDAIVAAGRTPGFFELKRTRDTGPIFGERPEI